MADSRAAGPAAHRPPVVMQVVQSFDRGGLEALAVNLAVGIQAAGARSVVVGIETGGILGAALDGAGVAHHVIGNGRYRDLRTQRAMLALFREHQPTAVHTHHFAALACTALAARLARVPRLVHTEHAFQYLEARPALKRPLRWMSTQVSSFVVVGAAMRDFYVDAVGVDDARMRVVVNGVDTERFHPPTDRAAARRAAGLPAEGVLVGTAGRFATVKNFPMLLDAVAHVRRSRPDLRLVLAGDGADRAALEAQAATLGFGEAIHFLGWRTDLPEILRCLDVFALTSWTEGLPLVMLEAMASGVPVVATGVGDIPHLVQRGITGELVEAGDVAGLAAALAPLVDDGALRARMGAAGRAFVARDYSQDTMVRQYLAEYGLPSS